MHTKSLHTPIPPAESEYSFWVYNMFMKREFLIGIDEVGRGPIAGPVAVCAVVLKRVPKGFLKGIRNSKALSEKTREAWYKKAVGARKTGALDFAVSFSSARFIDRYGISKALRVSIARALHRLEISPTQAQIFLDGSIYAPKRYVRQKTIIKGDERVPIIALASIIAKVRRDRRMKRYAKKFRGYGFEEHVGYGTAAHYKAIRARGLCKLHRRSFIH